MDERERYSSGMRVRRAVLGEDYVERAQANKQKKIARTPTIWFRFVIAGLILLTRIATPSKIRVGRSLCAWQPRECAWARFLAS